MAEPLRITVNKPSPSADQGPPQQRAGGSEYAEIIVNGQTFRDWTTVMVIAVHNGPREFHFTATEASPVKRSWPQLQIKPGDKVQVYLAGQLAVTGEVIERQTSYDANQHGIMIAGYGDTGKVFTSSAVPTKGGQYKNQTFEQIAKDVLRKFSVNLSLPQMPSFVQEKFRNVQIVPGDFAGAFLERIARMRSLVLGEDEKGGMVAHSPANVMGSGGDDRLIEGENILSASVRVSHGSMNSQYSTIGQDNSTDKKWPANNFSAWTDNPILKSLGVYKPLIQFAERPGTLPDVKIRNDHEASWQLQNAIEGDITKYGWLKANGQLWNPLTDTVFVYSPMLMVNTRLKIKSVTYTQDDRGGTLTKLSVYNDYAAAGNTMWDKGAATNPAAPGDSAAQTPSQSTDSIAGSNAPAQPSQSGDPWGMTGAGTGGLPLGAGVGPQGATFQDRFGSF